MEKSELYVDRWGDLVINDYTEIVGLIAWFGMLKWTTK